VVVVPIGGGGLIAGIAAVLKALRPEIRVIGVEAEVLPAALRAREAGEPVTIAAAETLADGIAVRRIGGATFAEIERNVDEVVTVSEEELANTILLLLEREKTVAEGAGAAGIAAVVHGKVGDLAGRCVAIPISGGNIDVNLLSRIIDRGLTKDGRLARLKLRVSDRPGALARLTAIVAEASANVLHLDHRRGAPGLGLTEAEVLLTVETRGHDHVRQLEAALRAEGYAAEREHQ
jgi:threonine dehydratase